MTKMWKSSTEMAGEIEWVKQLSLDARKVRSYSVTLQWTNKEWLGITPNKTHGTKIYGRLRLEKSELCPAMGGRRSGTRTERGSITSSAGEFTNQLQSLEVQHQKNKKGRLLGKNYSNQKQNFGESLAVHLWKHIGWMLVLPQAPGEHWRIIPKMRWSLRFPSFCWHWLDSIKTTLEPWKIWKTEQSLGIIISFCGCKTWLKLPTKRCTRYGACKSPWLVKTVLLLG